MRFCELFLSYKIGLKGIKNTIPFTKLPLYRKIAVIVTFAITIVAILLSMFKLLFFGLITLGTGVVSIIIFLFIDSRKSNLELMLKEHYSPYSQKRMNMVIGVLYKYGIDIHNSNTIELLILEAQEAQIQSDFLLSIKKPLKTLAAIIVPIVAYVAQKIGDTASQNEMILMATEIIIIVLLIFSLILSLAPLIKDMINHDYNKYSEFIYDLRQIKLFYANDDKCLTLFDSIPIDSRTP